MNATPDPLAGELAESISTARTCGELHDLRVRLQHTVGILDTERAALLAALRQRENELVRHLCPAVRAADF